MKYHFLRERIMQQQINSRQYFSIELLTWYERSKRDLPWRRSRNPYYIWVSEIMLQQTRVDTVIPYFERFIARFPTIEALATAPEEDVLKCWEGLGYYSRARNLQTAAQQVVELHGGEVPNDTAAVAALKGVGPYTTGAIMSIAFNRPEPAVDGNVMRVLSRYFLIEEDIVKVGTRKLMEKLVVELIPEDRASDFNQALMELGALVCTPKSPSCLTCPVMAYCAGRIEGMEMQLPIKSKSKPPRPELRYVALVEGTGEHAGKVLVRRRPDTGLLAKMWELPHVLAEQKKRNSNQKDTDKKATDKKSTDTKKAADIKANNKLSENNSSQLIIDALASPLDAELFTAGFPAKLNQHFMNIEHIFSHILWEMHVFQYVEIQQAEQALIAVAEHQETYDVNHLGDESLEYRWITQADMESLTFPNVFLKILNQYFNNG
jgi:A/G-specific adenine glycosylase